MADDEKCCAYDPKPETLLQASGTLNALYAIPLLLSPEKAKAFYYVKVKSWWGTWFLLGTGGSGSGLYCNQTA